MGRLTQNKTRGLVLASEGRAGIPSPRSISSSWWPLGFGSLPAGCPQWECVCPVTFCRCWDGRVEGVGVPHWCAGACAGLAARLGATRHVPGWRRDAAVGLATAGWGFVAREIPLRPRGPGCCREDAPGCRTVPRPRWDVRFWGKFDSRLVRWHHPQLPGDGSAWPGWQGTAGDTSLPPGKVPHSSTGKRPWGCLGLGVGGPEGVGGATPGAGGTIYGQKYLPERKFLVERWEFSVPLALGWGRGGGQRPVLGREKPSPVARGSRVVSRPPWVPLARPCPGSHLPAELRGTSSPFARAALAFGLLRLEKPTPNVTPPQHGVEAAQDPQNTL